MVIDLASVVEGIDLDFLASACDLTGGNIGLERFVSLIGG